MSSYFGGNGADRVGGLQVDGGSIYLVGQTDSTNLPTTSNALQRNPGGDFDAFVARIRLIDRQLEYCSYLGGAGSDETVGQGLSLDRSGNLIVVGDTDSANFMVTPGVVQPTPGGGVDTFVTKFKLPGSAKHPRSPATSSSAF